MQEEARLDDQCKQFPGLAKARENFEVFKSMVDSKESK